MIMLSDLWRTEEHKQEGNTNKNKKASSEDRKRTFSNDSDASSEKSAIETEGRTSEARRICCKARLLSRADHNADNAYFEIPLDTPHGMVMSCSHPKCAASGRRFRYCRVCEVPVAKRNFLKRHEHRGQIRSLVQKEVQVIIDGARGTCCTTTSEPTSDPCNSHKYSSSTERSSNASVDTEPSIASQPPTRVTWNHNYDSSGRNKFAGVGRGSNPTTSVAAIEQEWLDLLNARLDIHVGDEVRTAVWLDRVMTFNSGEKLACPPVLTLTYPVDPRRGSVSRQHPSSHSEETGVHALLTLGGELSSSCASNCKYGEPRMQQQPNDWHPSAPLPLSIESGGSGTFLSHQESSVIPEPLEAIVSRSTHESARAASELEEVIAFMYDFGKDQRSKVSQQSSRTSI